MTNKQRMEKIEFERQDRGMDQKSLSKLAGIAQGTYNLGYRGLTDPTELTISKLEKALWGKNG